MPDVDKYAIYTTTRATMRISPAVSWMLLQREIDVRFAEAIARVRAL